MDKDSIRREVYRRLIDEGVSKPPYPIEGRIPNFAGAEEAASRLTRLKKFLEADVIKINPDSPQRPVRYMALSMGKKVVMPTPRIKKGFIFLDPDKIRDIGFASTIRGAFRLGKIMEVEDLPRIEYIVEGSVAVSPDGSRLGKGEGYAELEYAILLEYGKIDYDVEIVTTVHELQIVDYIPRDVYDVSINYIVTPRRIVRCKSMYRPNGIIWDALDKEKIMEIPILKKLWESRHK
ncbi:MAG TPA: 5-formyltetrahydrofolate cyclo-ligase [Thermoprotei archaeon]|nr:5-formyltetrahydrofolate cyclo-ligase [Thermoprotei archaeon]